MAELTDVELKERIKQYDSKKPLEGDDLDLMYRKLGTLENFDGFDAETLEKASVLIRDLKLPANLKDSLQERIEDQKRKLAANQPAGHSTEETDKKDSKTFDNTEQDQPKKENKSERKYEAEADTEDKGYKYTRFDEMTSYDLYMLRQSLAKQLEEAVKNGEDIKSAKFMGMQLEIDEIADYAAEQMNGLKIDEDNAPAARDYIGILTAADANYDYDIEELERNLDKYDQKYGLDDDLPSAHEIKANEDSWDELTKTATLTYNDKGEFRLTPELEKDAGIQALRKGDPATLKETMDILRTIALTELSLEEPDPDPKKAMARYHEKVGEVCDQYLTTVNLRLQTIMRSEEETKIWLGDYLKNQKITKQQWDEMQKDPSKALAAQNDFMRYVASGVYTATNAVFVEKNDVFASRMAQKANMEEAPARAAKQKRSFTQKHPKIIRFAKEGAKNGLWTYGLLYGTGPIGLTARTGWKLVGAIKTSYKNYKQSDSKNFFQYLGKNKEEAHNLIKQAAMFGVSAAFTGAMAASGMLTFGALGSLTGIGATAAAGQAATHMAILGVTKLQAMGALSAVTSAGSFWFARHKLAPKKKELMAVLEKYAPSQEKTPRQGLLGKILPGRTPAEAMYKKITGTFKDLDDEQKVAKMLQEFAPNMSAEDKEAVINLAKEVQNIKAASYGAAAGVAMGAGMAESQEIVKAFSGDTQPQTLAEQPSAPAVAPENTEEAPAVTEAEAPVAEAQHISADQLKEGSDLYNATQVGPTVIYKKLISMGVITQEDADKIMAEEGRDYIPSRVLRNHMQDDFKFTPEQEKELNDFINDKATFKRLCDEENARAGINNHGGNYAGGNPHGGNSMGGNGNTAPAAAPAPQPQGDEHKGDAVVGDPTEIENKGDADKPNANQEAIARVTGKIKNHTGATAFLYQKHEHEATLDLNKLAKALGKKPEELTEQDKLNAQTDVYAKTYVMEKKGISASEINTTNYSTTGRIIGEDGVEHKIKVKNTYDEDKGIQTYTRRVETDHGTERTTVKSIHHDDGTQTSFGKYKNAFVDGATVGEADGGNDEMIGKVTDSHGNSRTFIKDGKTGDMYEVTKLKGQEEVVTKSSYTESQIKSLIKHRDEVLSRPLRPSNER